MISIPSHHPAAPAHIAHSLAGWLLRVNGGLLMATGLAALTADLLGYFRGVGPFASLAGQPIAIGSVEAHGLGALVGFLLWRAAITGQHWSGHALAVGVHLFLCLCNLLFWQIYTDLQINTVGVVSTTAHAVFFTAQLVGLVMLRLTGKTTS